MRFVATGLIRIGCVLKRNMVQRIHLTRQYSLQMLKKMAAKVKLGQVR
jgi:hypothetical protein